MPTVKQGLCRGTHENLVIIWFMDGYDLITFQEYAFLAATYGKILLCPFLLTAASIGDPSGVVSFIQRLI